MIYLYYAYDKANPIFIGIPIPKINDLVFLHNNIYLNVSVTRKKSPNVYASCPNMISLEKW